MQKKWVKEGTHFRNKYRVKEDKKTTTTLRIYKQTYENTAIEILAKTRQILCRSERQNTHTHKRMNEYTKWLKKKEEKKREKMIIKLMTMAKKLMIMMCWLRLMMVMMWWWRWWGWCDDNDDEKDEEKKIHILFRHNCISFFLRSKYKHTK